MIRFLHAADLHLDSPLRGLERYEGCPRETLRVATREALRKLVTLAIEERVQFVLIAGDVYDGDWQDYNTGLFFHSEMAKLRESGILVYLISGNHDAQNKMTRSLALPDNVRRFNTTQPETIDVPEWNLIIHGQGFAQQKVVENLAASYPRSIPGRINIGMLHTCLEGAEGHESYAPCSVEELRGKGYDYWALGHVHTRRLVHDDPMIVFPGNTQGRSIREQGERGCMLVSLEEHSAPQIEFRPLDVARWEIARVNVDACDDPEGLPAYVSRTLADIAMEDGMIAAVRVQFEGRTRWHSEWTSRSTHWIEEVRNVANNEFPGRIWIEKVLWRTQPPSAFPKIPDSSPLAELQNYLTELRGQPEQLVELCGGWEEWQLLAQRWSEVSADQPDLASMLDEVTSVLARHLEGEGPP